MCHLFFSFKKMCPSVFVPELIACFVPAYQLTSGVLMKCMLSSVIVTITFIILWLVVHTHAHLCQPGLKPQATIASNAVGCLRQWLHMSCRKKKKVYKN